MSLNMFFEIISIALPSIVANLSWVLVEVINIMFVGHLGEPELVAGVGIGNVFINIFGWVILFGLNQTLVTLVSQSYGQGNLQLCGIYLNRGRVITMFAAVPITIVFYQSGNILLAAGIDAETAKYAQIYIF